MQQGHQLRRLLQKLVNDLFPQRADRYGDPAKERRKVLGAVKGNRAKDRPIVYLTVVSWLGPWSAV